MARIILTGVWLLAICLSLPAMAGERVRGTSFFMVDDQGWETGADTGYWIWHGNGIQNSTEGPLGTNPIECHGAGFWDANGSWGEGICRSGSGDDIRTIRWWREKGEKIGYWEDLHGTGKFAGMTGQGTYVSKPLPDGRQMSEWEGEVTMAQ